MEDRYFPNEIPDYIPEAAVLETDSDDTYPNSLTKLLHLPYDSLSLHLRRAALDIKERVVTETLGSSGMRLNDYSMYTGTLGTAFLLFKAYQVTKDKKDLLLCSQMIKSCEASFARSSEIVTFICGQAGVYALSAVVARQSGDEQLCQHYLNEFSKIKISKELPNELLYGRSGFLWACSFLDKYIGKDAISRVCSFLNKYIAKDATSSTRMREVVDEMMKSGRQMGNERCPLMYEWHGKRYWGAAHGLAGIMHVLMDIDLKPDEVEDVKNTLRYMIKNRFPSGNYPSSEDSESDRLVHWCHGAPGVALTLAKAAQVFNSKEFLEAAIEAGEVVWNRGLLKRVGLCHGISGNAYVFLALYRLTGKMKYMYRAKAFTCFLHDKALSLISKGIMHGGDRHYSLFEGIGGMAYLFLDMVEPNNARFPAYEL